MKTIALVVGHGPTKDKGAVNPMDGTTELDWNRDLAKRISAAIGDRAKAVIVNREVEKVSPVGAVNRLKAAIAVELHLNAFNAAASGTEMIHWPTSKNGKALAQALQNAAVSVLGLPNRGIKGPQGGGRGAAFLRDTAMPAVIVESFFIDNKSDLARGNLRKEALAASYADALVQFVAWLRTQPMRE